ncbi:protein of unknown function [Taphrina deformans PYCC 5710]|uniref:Uncharacterized protein n=1 Tax=Taphrina deformans (strain PYCC 5710 / ATCC 11124 / CBS 356.35 / IMI 108563 / JCM 9778 / NBRC 8474) TaxID=1097556 RepID=R4XMP7_TAPDE|nr:protein of unknown function [Taphrina deformans PYCC 5710]|eukprot:CCG84582.1 protein of unknown function [Taphrina deformans PYCC 5710]
MLSFKSIIAFGDAFSAQCGTRFNRESNSLDINLSSWTDFRSGLYGNPIFTDCAANHGLNYLNFLTNCTQDGVDPLTCPISLVDLAYGDLLQGNESRAGEAGAALPAAQLDVWRRFVRPDLTFRANETLVSVFYGSSEVSVVSAGLAEGDPQYRTEVEILERVEVIEQSMNALYDDGLRHFLIFNMPHHGAEVSSLTGDWNRLLGRRVGAFRSEKSEAKVYFIDTDGIYNDFLAAPGRYGFTDTDEWCATAKSAHARVDCSETSPYLLMDGSRWTPRAHRYLASAVQHLIGAEMQTGVTNGTMDANVRETLAQFGNTLYDNRVVVATALFLPILVILAFLLIHLMRRRGASILRVLEMRRGGQTYARVPAQERVPAEIELQPREGPGQPVARGLDHREPPEPSTPRDDFGV